MKAKPAEQSVREALQVFRLATISRQAVIVDERGKLVYAKASAADRSDTDALQVLTAKIEQELSRHAREMSEVREHWIPRHLPSLESVRNADGRGMLEAIESLTVEWHEFVKTHDLADHQEWQQTQLRRYGFLNQIDQRLPLGIRCSAEDGVVAVSTITLSQDDTRKLVDRIVSSRYNELDKKLGIAEQTVKDAPRTESLLITLPGTDNGGLTPSTLKLRFPKPEALIDALQTLYERQQDIVRAATTTDATVAPADRRANFVKLASLLTNQTAMNLLDDFRYPASAGAPDTIVPLSTKDQTETCQVRVESNGDLIVDRVRWERWDKFICQDIWPLPLPVNRGANWEGPLDDTNFSYRVQISLRLRREDIEQGVFRPILTRSPQLSACIELDWASIDPVLKRAADNRRPRSNESSQEFSPRS